MVISATAQLSDTWLSPRWMRCLSCTSVPFLALDSQDVLPLANSDNSTIFYITDYAEHCAIIGRMGVRQSFERRPKSKPELLCIRTCVSRRKTHSHTVSSMNPDWISPRHSLLRKVWSRSQNESCVGTMAANRPTRMMII